jgi:serine phosphatase RsbU (regulator of sigma subunit)
MRRKARKRGFHLFDTGRDTGKAVTPVERLTAEVDALRDELRRRVGGLPDPVQQVDGLAHVSMEWERWEATLLLQRAILPTPLQRFSLGRYEVSARYRPAESGNRVAGDWYDARLGPDGSAVVAIGDVAGHGLVAAAGMARIGNALRGLSATGHPANALLRWLNRLICSDESPERVASAAVFVLDQDRPALRWAQAGHPPPVLVSGGAARLLARPSGLLLGTVPTAEYDLAEEELAAGDVLFLYTDGLIERRDRDIDEGLMALLAAAGGEQRQTADEAIAALLDRLDPLVAEDDMCLLAVRVS